MLRGVYLVGGTLRIDITDLNREILPYRKDKWWLVSLVWDSLLTLLPLLHLRNLLQLYLHWFLRFHRFLLFNYLLLLNRLWLSRLGLRRLYAFLLGREGLNFYIKILDCLF
jgi:hypothetical protein